MLDGSLEVKSKKKKRLLTCDKFDTFATYAGIVYDIDTDCMAQNHITHGCVLETFRCEMSIFHKQDEKSREKLLCVDIFVVVPL